MVKSTPLFLLVFLLSCNTHSTTNLHSEISRASVNVPAQNIEMIDAEMFRKHWSNYVSLKLSKCEKVIFGGFKRVEFTLDNDSPYMIDSICVKVNYIEDGNKLYKTGLATAVDIEQGETIILDAPYSLRGDSLNFSIDYLKVGQAKLNYRKKVMRRG